MPQVNPHLRYPGGFSAFFTDLHLDFPRWLRLVALVPLVHASIEGISYEELCFHLLGIFSSSNPSNVLVVSADRIRSSVSEMLFKEPFFVCSLPDNGPLSTSRWVYESSFDSDPSRISFAFSILRCLKLSPDWSVRDILSGLTSVQLLPNVPISASNESQDLQSVRDDRCHWPSHSTSTTVVRVPISSLIGPATSPARTGLDSSSQQNSPLAPVLGSVISFDPPRPRRSLYLPHDSALMSMEVAASLANLRPDTDNVPSHFPQFHEIPRRFHGTPEQSCIDPQVAEDMAADFAIGTQHKVPVSASPVHSCQLPGQHSASRCNSFVSSYATIPLFLPSQTPNRDPSQTIPSPQDSNLAHDGRYLSQDNPMRCTEQPHTDYPRSDSFSEWSLEQVDTEGRLEGAIPVHESGSLAAGEFLAPKPSLPLPWSDGPTTDVYPQTLSAESNHARPHSASLSNVLGKRGVTHQGIPADAQSDTGRSETSVRAQKRRIVRRRLIRRSTKVPKRMGCHTVPVHATALDAHLSTPSACALEPLVLSPLAPHNFSDHDESTHGAERRTHTLDSSDRNSQVTRSDRSSCTILTPSSSAPQSGPTPYSFFLGTSRPSVVVYKVAIGPNIAGSRNVVRVSYGEGHRKRAHPTISDHRGKERNMGRPACPPKEYDNAKRGDPAKHPNRKAIRPIHYSAWRYRDEQRSASAGLQRSDTKMPGKLPPAERIEGDMAWDFGAVQETRLRRVDADRSRVRVGGLTSVRMIPRSAVDRRETSAGAAPPTT